MSCPSHERLTRPIMTKLKPQRQIVNVHSAAIHIENKVGLKQRQAWFYLLYKAFHYLQTQETYQISLADLKRAIDYKSEFNNQHLKEMLTELVNITVEWNIFDKDREVEWGVSGLLADCAIRPNSGICEYSFGPALRKRLYNPSMYTKLNLLISRRFTSKHALAIYCLALDYLNVQNNYGEKNLTISELRKYLGIDKGTYDRVVDLHRHVLKRAAKDINEESDIQITIKPIRISNQKIVGFKFCMSIKTEHIAFYQPQPQKMLPDATQPPHG